MNIKRELAELIKYDFGALGVKPEELIIESISADKGDFSLPCFSFAKVLRKSPQAIAEEIGQTVEVGGLVERTEVIAGYLNFFLNKPYVTQKVIEEILNSNLEFSDGQGKVICIDYSSVNLAKYMHIGHLKNTIIGESIARIAEALGYKVVRINYVGDYGTPFGKIIAAYELWGNKQDVENRGVDALQDLYVRFNQEAEKDDALNDKAREIFKKVEEKDAHYYPIYQEVIKISIAETKRLLDLLGVKFDSWRGEAYYSDKLPDVVKLLTDKGIASPSQGALVVDLAQFDMPPCLIRRTDGASLYATRDIAAAIDRFENYHFDQMFYVTGHEQMLHFKQFFKVLELAGFDFARNLEHIHYGLFNLPTGKISSRKGKQATLVDLINLALDKATSVIQDKTFKILNRETVAKTVAFSALSFNVLKVEVGKDCTFDVEKAFSFEGETSPYMQYSFTRIEGILRKAPALENALPDFSVLSKTEAFELVKMCNSLHATISLAFSKREPSIIVKRAMDICKMLNKFYTTTRVLDGAESEVKAKLMLLKTAKKVLEKLFNLMCIETLEEM